MSVIRIVEPSFPKIKWYSAFMCCNTQLETGKENQTLILNSINSLLDKPAIFDFIIVRSSSKEINTSEFDILSEIELIAFDNIIFLFFIVKIHCRYSISFETDKLIRSLSKLLNTNIKEHRQKIILRKKADFQELIDKFIDLDDKQ